MIYSSLEEIPYSQFRVIIINVGTRFVTTLSLLSAINKAKLPVLLIDCKYKDKDDYKYWTKLHDMFSFDLLSLPLNNHEFTLDRIFSALNADYVLLQDSDLVLHDGSIVDYMKENIINPKVFGVGFRHGGFNIQANKDFEGKKDAYYEERMWIPFVMLKVECIKESLNNGKSFFAYYYYNLFEKHQKLSKKILCSSKILRFPHIQKLILKVFYPFRKRIHNQVPDIIFGDTGAQIYEYLRYEKFLYLAGMDSETGLESKYVTHYNGITRRLLFDDPFNTGNVDVEFESIRNQMLNEYNFDILKFEKENEA